MELEKLIEIPTITADDTTLLKEIFSHPVVIKYLETLTKQAILDIALTGITSDEKAEEYIRKTLYSKGSLSVLKKLLSIAD